MNATSTLLPHEAPGLALQAVDRLIQHILAFYGEQENATLLAQQLSKAAVEWHDLAIYVFHGWTYLLLACFLGFFVVLAIGKTLRGVLPPPIISKHIKTSLAQTCRPKDEPFWRSVLLALNILISYPTFTQVWSLGLFLVLFFHGGPYSKTILLIYYIHLFTDNSPQHSGWDEDASWLACLLGFNGQNAGKDKDSVLNDNIDNISLAKIFGFGFPFRNWCRRAWNFRMVREYFDAELIRTCELKDAHERNYMFLYHPHGIMAIGASATLSTDVAGFPELFPGVHRSTCVLNACFLIPFFRDWMLANGFVSANRSTLLEHLTTESPRRKSLILMPGGSAEALHAHPGVLKVYLKSRRGFIRVALETGCSLVPCLGFGENEVYETLYTHESEHAEQQQQQQNGGPSKNQHSPQRGNDFDLEHMTHLMALGQWKRLFFLLQRKMTKMLTFSVPMMTHALPRRTKITVVVGEPIHCDQQGRAAVAKSDKIINNNAKPDAKLVDQYHALYCQKLKELYDQHKSKYGIPGVELEIV